MSSDPRYSEFVVRIIVQIAGPVRLRTKYKKHKLLRAEGGITLPFAVPRALSHFHEAEETRRADHAIGR